MTEIGALIKISTVAHQSSVFCVQNTRVNSGADQRLLIGETSASQFQARIFPDSSAECLWAIPHSLCGDSPTQYHPKFLMAFLSSLPAKAHNIQKNSFLLWQFPTIRFETDEWTRRSMTLNGMRMSTEYFASGSPRVLQLIEQRLKAGQADVVHDVLVYLMQRVLELGAAMDEERALQAESLAAYLGLNAAPVQQLLSSWPLQTLHLTEEIQNGFAGVPRSLTNLSAFIENQLARFSTAFEELKEREAGVLRLIDEVVVRLYNHSRADC